MALLDARLDEKGMLLRELLYGPAKAKKTWWVGKAAEAGFNVLLFDGDDGWHILKQIKPEAQHRIQVIDVQDQLGQSTFAPFVTRMLKFGVADWNPKTKAIQKINPSPDCVHIDLTKLGKFDIVVLDSWTALVRSLMMKYARENMIDLSDAEEGDDKWGFYRWAGALGTWITGQLTSLPCHVVVIAHVTQYEKRSKDQKTILSSRRQIKSTSGPHAMQMPSQFSDVLYFYPHGKAFKIDTSGSDEADGGSRLVAPGIFNWDDLQFVDLIKAAQSELPPKDNPLIDYSMPVVTKKVVGKTKIVKPVNKPQVKLNVKRYKKLA